ncbi:hypothetical protein B0H13DRAFT_2557871 [Mycena leptocephala]|nr:hypothetical protein B0H13DRAFT_2557871 [Mycena leptocephala]
MSTVLIDHGTPPSIPTALLPASPTPRTRYDRFASPQCGVLPSRSACSSRPLLHMRERVGRRQRSRRGTLGATVFALVCIVLKVPRVENPNRAGFLALAQLPPVFLFASKNSPLTALLLGPGVD